MSGVRRIGTGVSYTAVVIFSGLIYCTLLLFSFKFYFTRSVFFYSLLTDLLFLADIDQLLLDQLLIDFLINIRVQQPSDSSISNNFTAIVSLCRYICLSSGLFPFPPASSVALSLSHACILYVMMESATFCTCPAASQVICWQHQNLLGRVCRYFSLFD